MYLPLTKVDITELDLSMLRENSKGYSAFIPASTELHIPGCSDGGGGRRESLFWEHLEMADLCSAGRFGVWERKCLKVQV